MSGACALQCPSTTLQLWRHHNTRYFPIYIFSKPRRKSFYIHNKSTFLFNKQNHLTVKTATVANMSANHRNQNILQPNLRAFCATLSCVRLNPSLKKTSVCAEKFSQDLLWSRDAPLRIPPPVSWTDLFPLKPLPPLLPIGHV